MGHDESSSEDEQSDSASEESEDEEGGEQMNVVGETQAFNTMLGGTYTHPSD